MFDKLEEIEKKYEEITEKLSQSEVVKDQKKFQEYSKEASLLSKIISRFREYKKTIQDIEDAKDLLNEEKDEEMRKLAESELEIQKKKKDKLEAEISVLLMPRDPWASRDIIIEIRAGTGGEEAALFAADLFKMYKKYAEKNKWNVDILSTSPSEIGGFKEIVFEVKGKDVYQSLKYEAGVHRVQRVPVTESGGRIHTSAATVAVLPEPEEVEVNIKPEDLRIDVFRASSAGGQYVNVTDSAVRITHLSTGMVVSCQDERSQYQNKEKAMRILRARLYEKAAEKQESKIAQERKMQVGTGDRSEKIRTYNFPQSRVTDHRIGLSLHKLDSVMEGNIDEIIEALRQAEIKIQTKDQRPKTKD